ncbi:MAG: lysylphosphatidylglycerol synthase transmembrane domain-containing protein [Candidatus Nanopelagicales bacterium]
MSEDHETEKHETPESSQADSQQLDDAQAREQLGITNTGIDKKKSIILGIIAVVFLIIVFFRVIPQIGSYSEAAEALENMTMWSIVAIVAAVIFYLWVYGWPFVASTPGLKYKSGFIVNQSAFAVSNGVPGGGAIGLGLQYAQLTSYRTTPTAATASIGATGIWSVFITLFLPVTGVLALTLSGDQAGNYVLAAVIGVAILIVVVGLFALILRSEKNAIRVGHLADKVANWAVHLVKKDKNLDVTSQIIKLRGDIVELVRRRWIWITITQIAVSWSQFGILYWALHGVAGDMGAPPVLVAYGCWAISQLGIMIPITPGGLGTVDAAMIGLMISMGIDDGTATAAALVWRASSYIPQIIIGLISIFYWRFDLRRENAKLQKAQANAA